VDRPLFTAVTSNKYLAQTPKDDSLVKKLHDHNLFFAVPKNFKTWSNCTAL
jgi:hypothetical protein